MRLRIGEQTIEIWTAALRRAGPREIGGVLFGEHVGEGDFRLVEATIQARGGSAHRFHRRARKARREIEALSRRHGDDAARFNYLGEWHSHPHAPAVASCVDKCTIFRLLQDPDSVVNFLVLLINRLDERGELELSAVSYLASGHMIPCHTVIEAQ